MRIQNRLNLQAILSAIQGTKVNVIIIDELDLVGTKEQLQAIRNAKVIDTWEIVNYSMIEPEAYVMCEQPPLPKPTQQKLFIKEPKRQSFRQSMRSVNRNR